jgi:hypothetical protein
MMAKKTFYLVKRKDALTDGKPTFYARFRSPDGELLPWRSTGEITRTKAEIWAKAEEKRREQARPGSDMVFVNVVVAPTLQ